VTDFLRQLWGFVRPYRERFLLGLIRLSPLLGVLQNDAAPMVIDNTPFFDLLQRSKAAEAVKVIV